MLIFIVVALFTYMAKEYVFHNHLPSLPPMPSRPLPFVGHLLAFVSGAPELVLKKWREKLGTIYSIYLGSQLSIMVADYESTKEMFVKKHEIVAEKAGLYVLKVMSDPEKGMNGIVGDDWREQRATMIAILKSFGMGKEVMAQRVAQEVPAFTKALSDLKGKARDIRLLLRTATSNVMFSVLVGHGYEYGDPLYTELVQLLNEQLLLLNQAPLVDFFDWVQHLPTFLYRGNKVKTNTQYFFRFFRKYIDKFRDEPEDENPDNFIKAYLREKKKAETDGKLLTLREEDLESLAYSLLLASIESTGTTIAWTLVYSIKYPDMQKKIYEEIKQVVGTNRSPSINDRRQMPYILSFTSEVQRITNMLPIVFPRICGKTTKLGGYTIPEGAYVSPVLEGIVLDEKLLGDPLVFRPERFMDESGIYSIPEYHIPFFLGRRTCPGEALAMLENFLFLSTIIQRFEMLPEKPGCMPSLEPNNKACRAPFPFRACFVERA